MSNPHLSTTLAAFSGRMQKTKNRLVAVPADVQRRLGLERRDNNHILLVSMRPKDDGRWNHHLVKLTFDCEFAIPSDAVRFTPGRAIDVKVHRVIPDASIETPRELTGAGVLLAIAASAGAWRSDGSRLLDDYVAADFQDQER